MRLSHWIFILGFFLAMGSQAIEMENWKYFPTLELAFKVERVFNTAIEEVFTFNNGIETDSSQEKP